MEARYALRPDDLGWTIVDMATDAPAVVNETPMICMAEEMAQELAGLLNDVDAEKASEPLQ